MVFLAFTNWAFNAGANKNWEKAPTSCTATVTFENKYGRTITKYYKVEDVRVRDRKSVARIIANDGASCTLSVDLTGTTFYFQHSEEHASGLREEVTMYPSSISGRHYNSLKYKNFGGSVNQNNLTHLDFQCEVKTESGSFKSVPYKLDLFGLPR